VEIELIDGQTVEVDVNVSALTLFKLQKEKVIDGTFLKGFMKEEPDLDPTSILQGVYAAYRQANPKDYMSYQEFLENYVMSTETDFEIYFAIISKEARKSFKENFMKKAVSSGKK